MLDRCYFGRQHTRVVFFYKRKISRKRHRSIEKVEYKAKNSLSGESTWLLSIKTNIEFQSRLKYNNLKHNTIKNISNLFFYIYDRVLFG